MLRYAIVFFGGGSIFDRRIPRAKYAMEISAILVLKERWSLLLKLLALI